MIIHTHDDDGILMRIIIMIHRSPMRMASGAHLRGEGDGEATKEECPIDRGVATSACRQRYRWHLEKNATQMPAISWRLTGSLDMTK